MFLIELSKILGPFPEKILFPFAEGVDNFDVSSVPLFEVNKFVDFKFENMPIPLKRLLLPPNKLVEKGFAFSF